MYTTNTVDTGTQLTVLYRTAASGGTAQDLRCSRPCPVPSLRGFAGCKLAALMHDLLAFCFELPRDVALPPHDPVLQGLEEDLSAEAAQSDLGEGEGEGEGEGYSWG